MSEVDWVSFSVTYNKISYSTNGISVLSSVTVLILILGIHYYRQDLANRISFRMTGAIAACDLFASVAQMLSLSVPGAGVQCTVSNFGYTFFTLTYISLTAAIGLNLQLVFLYNVRNTKRYEPFYYGVSIFCALALTISPIAAGYLGYTENEGCWYLHTSSTSGALWYWLTFLTPLIICVSFCAVSVGLVTRRLRSHSRNITVIHTTVRQKSEFLETGESIDNSDATASRSVRQQKRQAHDTIRAAIKRILLYPMVPIITQTPNIIQSIYVQATHDQESRTFANWQLANCVMMGLTGFFNMCAFFFDPSFTNAWNTLKAGYVDSYKSEVIVLPNGETVRPRG